MCFVFGHTALYEGKTMLYLYTVKLENLRFDAIYSGMLYDVFCAKQIYKLQTPGRVQISCEPQVS